MKEGTSASEWIQRRNSLNHDWLKNQFAPALGACVNTMRGLVRDPYFGSRTILDLLDEWDRRAPEIGRLIDDFEGAVSPANFCALPPICDLGLEPATSEWLRVIVHEAWMTNIGRRGVIEQARENLARAQEYATSLRNDDEPEQRGNVVGLFQNAVRTLSTSLSSLPRRLEFL